MARSARRAEERVRQLDRGDLDDLVARAQARVLLAEAVGGLAAGDHATTRRALVAACALAPDLSSTPEAFLAHLRLAPIEDADGPRMIAVAARLWPDRDSDTARYLHGYGALRALRAGQVVQAARQLGPARAWLDPRFVSRTAPITARLTRGWFQQRKGRGEETDPTQATPGP